MDPAIKLARGTKRLCAACDVRFYDLTRSPIICPMCGAVHVPVSRREKDAAARSGFASFRPQPKAAVAEVMSHEVAVELDADIKEEPVEADADALPEEDLLLEVTEEEPVDAIDLIEPEADTGKEDR